jgi:two-component system, chemotaxis family, chemotaxis protein CheY
MGRKILIIDDSPISRKMLKSCFPPGNDFEFHEAGDGLQGFYRHQEFSPDITFLDLTMPVMDGATCLAEILKASPGAVVIISTADIQTKSIDHVMALGALTVLKKPPTKDSVSIALATAEERLRPTP